MQCTICIDEVKKSCTLSCGHTYHAECFKQWINSNGCKCPICRVDFLNDIAINRGNFNKLQKKIKELKNEIVNLKQE